MEQSSRTGIDRRGFLRGGGLLAAGIGAAPLISSCKGSAGGGDSDNLTIWWNQGYYHEEDQAAKDIVTKWQKKTGKKADLQLYGTQDIVTKEQSAVAAGEPPDIIYAQKGFTPTYAFQGKLEDLSDVIDSTDLTSGAKRAAHLYNQKADKVSYYSVPLHQFTVSMFYWRSLITGAGMDDRHLPTDWEGYWKFWKDVQDAQRDKGKKGVYAVGWPMGTAAGDTNYDTQQILRSFGVELLDDKSQLKSDDEVRKGIADALAFLGGLFSGGYTPKACINWQDDGNNTAFLSKTLVSTPNGSLSIPGALKDENDKDWKDMVTAVWPQRAVGGPMPSLSLTHNAIVFSNSKKKKLAKDFLSFMMQPENIGSVLEGGKGRWFPVNQSLLTKPFWSKSDDPNIKVVANQLASDTAANWADLSPAYQKVETTHVWGKAIGQIALRGKSGDDAADYALTQMSQIFDQFKH